MNHITSHPRLSAGYSYLSDDGYVEPVANISDRHLSDSSGYIEPAEPSTVIFLTPYYVALNVFALFNAWRTGNRADQINASLHLSGLTTSIIQRCLVINQVVNMSSLWNYMVSTEAFLGTPLIGLSIGLTAIEAAYEAHCLYQQTQLMVGLSQENTEAITQLTTLSRREITKIQIKTDGDASLLQTTLDQAKQAKGRNLIRRLGVPVAQELIKFANNQSSLSAAALMDITRKRNQKMILIHTIALAALLITATGFIASFFMPPFIPFVLLLTASALFAYKYGLSNGIDRRLESDVRISDWIPGFIWNRIYPHADGEPQPLAEAVSLTA